MGKWNLSQAFASVRQKFYHLHTSTESPPPTPHGLLLLPAPTADQPSSLTPMDEGSKGKYIEEGGLPTSGGQRYSKMYRLKRYRYTIFEKKIE